MPTARGSFEITMTPAPAVPEAPPGAPGRMSIAKTYTGGITGSGAGEMLATMGPDQSGAYVALERITGVLDGRTGAFTVVHRGVMDAGAHELSITVVPGSGDGELKGLRGVYHLTRDEGGHHYVLDYELG